MGKVFEKAGYVSTSIETDPQQRYVTIEVYDHRKRNPIIEFTVSEDVQIRLDLRDLLDCLSECDLTGFTAKSDIGDK
jgi:hypothetical protein